MSDNDTYKAPHEVTVSLFFGDELPKLKKVSSCSDSYWLMMNNEARITLHVTRDENEIGKQWLAHIYQASIDFWKARETSDPAPLTDSTPSPVVESEQF